MSVSAEDFMQSARALCVEASEMSQRNALSRAYYAAFHRSHAAYPPAADRGEAGNRESRAKGMHRRYLDQLQNQAPGTPGRIVGAKLTQLYQRRIMADYRLGESLKSDAVARQLDVAAQIFALLG